MIAKFTVANALDFPHHRSGWGYALRSIAPLLKPQGGVSLDPFVEATFNWDLAANLRSGLLPMRGDWVGFVHNPPQIPRWHEFDSAPESILQLPAWRQSMPCCRGLYTFSNTMRDWLQARVPMPVEALVHPTEASARMFSMEAFFGQPNPRIIQVGSWLRRLSSIALLPVERLRKTCLIAKPGADLDLLLQRERDNDGGARLADWTSVDIMPYRDNDAYDDLLSRNIVFLDLYDTVVNNAVIECVVRLTPIVCNRLPALVELLGEDYPLFYLNLAEAAAKAEDAALVERAHEHLKRLPKTGFTGEAFRRSIAEGAIYRDIA